jgi:heat shock protein HtpX
VLLVVAFVVVVAALGWGSGLLLGAGPTGLVVAVVVAGTAAVAAWWGSDAVALRMSHARPATEADCPRLHNLVEGLCIAVGLPKPRLYLVDDDAPNAFATGRDPHHAAVAVTTGLLDKLSRVELEGVLAHELSHVRNYDTQVSTLAVTLVGVTTFGRLLGLVVSRRRELVADVSGVSLTRYPPGLISALERLCDEPTAIQSVARATAHLWFEPPPARGESKGRGAWRNRLSHTHPPLEDRLNALREL